jgi:histidinol dehydrogenase
MLKQYDLPSALQTILRRTPPDEQAVSRPILDRLERLFGEPLTPDAAVARILSDVRSNGDAALRKWTHALDGLDLKPDPVSRGLIKAALDALDPATRDALEQAAARIEAFHRRQPVNSWLAEDMGGKLGQLIRPIQRVGLYIPGGSAPLPSTVLMSAIPARVAGVPEIVVVTPPARDRAHHEAPVDPVILAACALAGIEEIYLIGGAQAIAALAYGTESIARVDKICGPGNLFVTLAKRQVYGTVGIDGLAGPTETVVIADEFARPAWVAADLLAQAEHDPLASAILLTPSQPLIEKVQVALAAQIEQCERAEVIAASLQDRGGAVLTRDLDEAIDLANAYAPEHLGLSVQDPWQLIDKVQAAGGIFMGEESFEVLGDYIAGPSHVMPTGGSARFASPLNVWDFVRIVSVIALDTQTAQALGPVAATLARAEGLDAHARAALIRAEESQ